MEKLVALKLDGDLESVGVRVTLLIAKEGELPEFETTGFLPPFPELAIHLQRHWQEKYPSLETEYRIKPKKIIHQGSINQRIEEFKESGVQLCDRLTVWLNSEPFRDIDRRLRERLNPDEAIRFVIRTEDRQLQKLPWQQWDFFDRYPLAELALSSTQFERIHPSVPVTAKDKVRILAIFGDSAGLDLDKDRQLLESLPNAETTFLVEKSHQEINEQLWKPWDIIFFAGHSETEGETGRIYINPTESLTVDELWYGLKKAVKQGLKIAIFNSCDGLGLAQRLHDVQIPQMIVMRELVPDYVAQEFLKHFLTAFAHGSSFYLSVREAREKLQGLESQFPCASWLPVICQNLAQVPPTWQDLIQEPEPEIEIINPPNPPCQGVSKNDETVSLPSSPQFPWRGWQKVLLASAIATSLVMGVRSLGWLQPAELKAYDQLMQLRPDEGPDPRLLVVAVTEEDLRLPEQQQKKGSLSDLALYRLLQKLESYQPRVIGLDIFRDFSVDSKLAGLRTYLQQNNHFFAICHPSVLGEGRYGGISRPPDIPKDRQGFSNILPDSDGIVRRHLLSMDVSATSRCSASKALSIQLALHYLRTNGIIPKFTQDGNWQLGKVVFKRLQAPTGAYQKADTGGNQVILNYRSYRSLKEISEIVTLTDVLTGKVNPEVVNDRIILIGAMHSTSDYFPSPYSQEIPGVMLHAQMVSQILSAILEQRPLIKFWSWWWEVLWIWSWSLIGGVLVWRLRSIRLLLVGGVTLGILYGLSYYLLIQGYWVPLIPSALAIVATSGSLMAYSKGRDWTIGLLTSKYGKSCLF